MKSKNLADFPDFSAAAKLLEETKAKANAAKAEVSRLQEEINHQQRADTVAAEAEALLSGGEIGENVGGLRDQLAKARHQQRVAEKAVAMQRHAVDALRSQRSAEVCESLLPQYQALVGKAIAAAVSLSKAYSDLRRFRQAIEDGGAIVTLPPVPAHLQALGRWDDPTTNIHRTLADGRESGLIGGEFDKDAPTPKGAYDELPVGRELHTLAASPAGVFRAIVTKGGAMKVGEWLAKARDDFSRGAWSGN